MPGSFKGPRGFLTEETKTGASGGEIPLIPAAIVVETVAAYRNPGRRRLGDRIAKTCVVLKERVPVLA